MSCKSCCLQRVWCQCLWCTATYAIHVMRVSRCACDSCASPNPCNPCIHVACAHVRAHTCMHAPIYWHYERAQTCLHRVGRGDATVGNPHRAQIHQFELFELILLLNFVKRLHVERLEAAVSQSTAPSPPLISELHK